jgi:hypothetical protein
MQKFWIKNLITFWIPITFGTCIGTLRC